MRFKLTFQKLTPDSEISGVGTAGNIWIIINALDQISLSDTLRIDMETYPTINNENHEVFGTMNAWEYYFHQVQDLGGESELPFLNQHPILSYDKNYNNKFALFNELRNKFDKNFRLKEHIADEVEAFKRNHFLNKVTLGVQIRLTDMKQLHEVAPFEIYRKKIKKIIAKYPNIEQIFLATDDQVIITDLENSLNIPVISQSEIYRATAQKPDLSPFDRLHHVRKNHRFLLGKEVLKDILLLSSCQYLLKSEISAVSQLAAFFGPNIEKTFFVKSRFFLELKRHTRSKVELIKILIAKFQILSAITRSVKIRK